MFPPLHDDNLFNVGIITGSNAIKMLEWSNLTRPTNSGPIKLHDVPVVSVNGMNWRRISQVTWMKATIVLNMWDNMAVFRRPLGTRRGCWLMGGVSPSLPEYSKTIIMEVDPNITYDCHGFGNWMQPILTAKNTVRNKHDPVSRMYAGWFQLAPVVDFPYMLRRSWTSTEAIADSESGQCSSSQVSQISSEDSHYVTCLSSGSHTNRMYRAPSLADSEVETPITSTPLFSVGQPTNQMLARGRLEAYFRGSQLVWDTDEEDLGESYVEETDREGEER